MVKGHIQEDGITIVNIYECNIRAPQFIRQMLTARKGEIASTTIIVGDLNILLTSINRSSRQKINKKTEALNDTLDQMDLIKFTEHSIQKQQNIHSAQVYIERSPGQIISWVTNQALVNLRYLKSYQVSFPTTTL